MRRLLKGNNHHNENTVNSLKASAVDDEQRALLDQVLSRRDTHDKLNDLMVRSVRIGCRVSIQGMHTVPGNAVVRDIDEETGNVIIAVTTGGDMVGDEDEVQLVTVDDPRRVALYYPDEHNDDKSQLFFVAASVAEDVYESAMAQYHCFCQPNGAYNCHRLQAWRSSLSTPLVVNERVHVVGQTDGCLLSWNKSGVRIRFDNASVEDNICVEQVRRLDETPFCGSATSNQQLLVDSSKRPRPVLECSKEKMPYDSCRCPEKIDLVRLEKVVREHASAGQHRMKYVEQLAKALHDGETDERYWEWFKKLKRSIEISEMASALYDHLRQLPTDRYGCVVHIIEYRSKDIASRGWLFAAGRHVYEDQCPRVVSVQGMLPELRNRLVGKFAHDLDCDNSMTRILCSLATQMKLVHLIPTIIDYRDKRDKWLKRIIKAHPSVTNQEAKRLPTVVLCGGLYVTWAKALGAGKTHIGLQNFFEMLYHEVRTLNDQLLIQPRFQWTDLERRKLAAEGRNDGVIKIALLNLIVQSCENEILGVIHKTLYKHGWVVRALAFGSVIAEPRRSKKSPSMDDVIMFASDACKDKGWDVLLREKPLHGLHIEPLYIFEEAAMCVEEYLAHLERSNDSRVDEVDHRLELLSAAMDGAAKASMETGESKAYISPQRNTARSLRTGLMPIALETDRDDDDELSASGFSSSQSSDSHYSTDSPFTDSEQNDDLF